MPILYSLPDDILFVSMLMIHTPQPYMMNQMTLCTPPSCGASTYLHTVAEDCGDAKPELKTIPRGSLTRRISGRCCTAVDTGIAMLRYAWNVTLAVNMLQADLALPRALGQAKRLDQVLPARTPSFLPPQVLQ